VCEEVRKRFFFEKKKQKTSMTFAARVKVISPSHKNQMDKSFLLLFFKKEALACFSYPSHRNYTPGPVPTPHPA
jgi:hypothetical protein